MKSITYNSDKAVEYARMWAKSRNPKYYDFEPFELGGDCTNFVSQCLFAGASVMNFTKTFGWYYLNLNNRSPSWTGVQPLYNFLTNNKGSGPFGIQLPIEQAKPGDIIQLSFDNLKYSHSLFVLSVNTKKPEDILLACHTYDALDKPLTDYNFAQSRLIHILGVRV